MLFKRNVTVIATAALFTVLYACTNGDGNTPAAEKEDITTTRKKEKTEMIAHGGYLVLVAGCNDCHSPKTFTAQGLALDTTKLLSGHPAQPPLPPADPKATKPGQWTLMSGDVTAFVGPWGISYASNITPDSATGIGNWTEETFIKTLKTGKHLGAENGRPILPPMPWPTLAKLKDDDLSAIYAYLRSLPPVKNQVPAPTPPNEIK